MGKQIEHKKEKKDFWGTMLILLVFIILLLILIIVNPYGIGSSSSSNLESEEMINYMQDNNIIIYGSSKCSYCKKQLEEFEPYQTEIMDDGLYIYCDITSDMGCIGVESVPAWKKDGEIVHVGYLRLDEIKDVL